MDYEPYDSSGTDDDLPPSRQNKIPRAGRGSVNGRSTVMGSVPHPRMHKEPDMETQIHQLEQEAYISVLRAFKAQADAITWEKESLITELRKELRLSNEEHRELLARVNADDVIRKIRDWRQSVGTQQGMVHLGQPVLDPVPSPSVTTSRKKQKIAPSIPSQSFGDPSSFHSQPAAPANHPSSSNAKRGPTIGPKGKKQKSSQMLPGVPPTKVQNPSSGANGRVQAGSRISSGAFANDLAEAATFNSLIGRKVRTRWPDDNNFYEAVITDYNSVEDRHALVYDLGTPTETWEWIKLSEISPGDIQWEGEDPEIYNHGGYNRTGHGMNGPVRRDGGPGAGRVKGMTKGHSRKDFQPLQNCIKKAPEDIKLLNTDTLVKEVERVFSANNPDPLEIEEAKKVLKEHEKALADAIARLAELSDGEDGGGSHMHGRAMKENSRQHR